ncbi:ABC transporter ATP-binding protein [Streptomyces sp. NBC_00878]|uniref:ABC transporter ATP-binding protein n=1 Tax=Streptomyces sp. NBC_00878 TaxID=2975854 RepID=UPI002252FFBC|nr:ABC transporter ATP-binding protein [Streptomyces sp. NBC_00878]MCX4911678.1 ABC transporter ATP-binding protein [Streptomyces sp. NBC_00878]
MTDTTDTTPLLEVSGLRIALTSGTPIVDGVDLTLGRGEILGIVGESGSGKTTTALALLGYAQRGAHIADGSVRVAGRQLLGLSRTERRDIRGKLISYVPQDAGQALNPSLRIADSVADVLRRHREPAPAAVRELLGSVDLPATTEFGRRLPHQLSGGQQQRVTIATSLACEPPVIVMDEPTTGLDVLTQQSVLDEIKRLRAERGASLVYVSHDLAVVSQIADRVAVMYAGRIVEQGPTATLMERPRHPYTRGLLQSIPDHRRPARLVPMAGSAPGVEERPDGCAFAPRCPQSTDDCHTTPPVLETVETLETSDILKTSEIQETSEILDELPHQVRCPRWELTPPAVVGVLREHAEVTAEPALQVRGLRATHKGRGGTVVVAEDISFDVRRGECLALVGESGSGKTTIARCLVGLHLPDGGSVQLGDAPLPARIRKRSAAQRRGIQYVFQNPYQSLNPRRRIGEDLARPGHVLRGLSVAEARAEVGSLLERVQLSPRLADRYPSQLSGGERQRVAIARALAARPDVLVCDEVTSALDVSVQAAILEALAELRDDLGVALLFITHDLGVVSGVADRVLVLEGGRICETGPTERVLRAPEHPYTQRLVVAAPTLAGPPREDLPTEAAR